LFLLRRQLPLPGPFLIGTGVEVKGMASGAASSLFSSMFIRMSWGCLAAELTAWKPLPIAGDGDLVCALSPSTPTAWRAAEVTAQSSQPSPLRIIACAYLEIADTIRLRYPHLQSGILGRYQKSTPFPS
jgi:hypothetical protein